jgi:glycosyltransferase involved in cell wall biosynthesis
VNLETIDWPAGAGPRVLTLVGNDVTIDTRARKTAVGLASRGYRVIALGVDSSGKAAPSEALGQALVVRAAPAGDGQLSPNLVPAGRAEFRDRVRHVHAVERQRLRLAQRHLEFRIRTIRDDRDRSPQGVARMARLARAELRVRARRAPVIVMHRRFQVLGLVSRALSRNLRWPTPVRWRRDLPELHRNDVAVADLIDRLQPAVIHVHDVFHLFTAVTAKLRAEREGRRVLVVYDAHEHVPGLPVEARRRQAYAQLESEAVPHVDGIVTVSPGLIAHLERRFGRTAGLVLNAPDVERVEPVTDVRSVAGLDDDAVVLVYVGGIAPHRGGDLLLDALVRLPAEFHLVLVVNATTGYVAELMARATSIGVGERFHCVPYVASEAVVSYIRTADASLIPLSRDVENYEVALPNKLFQSIQAGVPVVTSDNPDLVAFVERFGIGATFAGGDAASLVGAVLDVLEHHEQYRAAVADPVLLAATTWAAQLDVLVETYSSLGAAP